MPAFNKAAAKARLKTLKSMPKIVRPIVLISLLERDIAEAEKKEAEKKEAVIAEKKREKKYCLTVDTHLSLAKMIELADIIEGKVEVYEIA